MRFPRVLTLCALGLGLPAGWAASAPAAPLRISGVQTELVRPLGAEDKHGAQGTAGIQLSGRITVPNASLDQVLAQVAGRVESIRVNPGDRVKAGQLIARLHSGELLGKQRAYLAARAQSELLTTRATRDQALFADGVIAESRLQATRAEAEGAAATLREQRQLLRIAGVDEASVQALRSAEDMSPLLSITARRAGWVLEQSVKVGQQVEDGLPLFMIASLDLLWLELQATREQAASLAVGDRIEVPGCKAAGQLIATGVQLDSVTQTVLVRAQLQGAADCVAPNQFVQVRVLAAGSQTARVSVPSGAVVHRAGKDYVFVQAGKGFEPTPVDIERYQGTRAWLRSGPAAGKAVAVTGVAALKGQWLGIGPAAAGTP
jgi:RND family efflux transporter MFP subunit